MNNPDDSGTLTSEALKLVGIPAKAAPEPVETPEAANSAESNESVTPEQAEPVSEVQSTQEQIVDWQSRYKELQSHTDKKLAELERKISNPAPVTPAPVVTVVPDEPQGVAAMRKLLEDNPDIADDPARMAQLSRSMSAQDTFSLIREWDEMKSYRDEAHKILGDEIDLKEIEPDAWEAYRIHKRIGKKGNPYVSAAAVVNQDKVVSKLSELQNARLDIASREAALKSGVKMEKPIGSRPPVKDEPEVRVSYRDYARHLVQSKLMKE